MKTFKELVESSKLKKPTDYRESVEELDEDFRMHGSQYMQGYKMRGYRIQDPFFSPGLISFTTVDQKGQMYKHTLHPHGEIHRENMGITTSGIDDDLDTRIDKAEDRSSQQGEQPVKRGRGRPTKETEFGGKKFDDAALNTWSFGGKKAVLPKGKLRKVHFKEDIDEAETDATKEYEEVELDERAPMELHLKKGAFHRWLGKGEDEAITQDDIKKGLNSEEPHVVKMANFAKNSRKWQHESVELDESARQVDANSHHYVDLNEMSILSVQAHPNRGGHTITLTNKKRYFSKLHPTNPNFKKEGMRPINDSVEIEKDGLMYQYSVMSEDNQVLFSGKSMTAEGALQIANRYTNTLEESITESEDKVQKVVNIAKKVARK